MARITFKNTPVNTLGDLLPIGAKAPNVAFTKMDLSEASLQDYLGKTIILNIFPSLDTEVCANSVRRFNAEANALQNTVILCLSADLPFAQKRFCGAEGLTNVIPGSVFRHPQLGTDYGVLITDGPLKGLLSRAIVIIDAHMNVTYTQQVTELTEEPDYASAIAAVK